MPKRLASWPDATFTVTKANGTEIHVAIGGRDRWALEQLIEAGTKGVTPIDNPAPRWGAYIHKLREAGVHVETVTEVHGGPFADTHARYVLRDHVCLLGQEAAA